MKRVRVVFCGEAGVGKSSLIQRFAENTFTEIGSTVAGAFHSAFVSYDRDQISLELWDTAGSERYHSVIPSFFKNASAVVIVYDVTNRETFDRIGWWMNFTRANSPNDALVFLVGNKVDLFSQRVVTYEEGKIVVERNGYVALTETSAKTGEAIDTLFSQLAELRGNGTIEVAYKGTLIELHKGSRCRC
jgi:small GTP-binding protein